jgi:outer membrane lipoprotein-sorting protein
MRGHDLDMRSIKNNWIRALTAGLLVLLLTVAASGRKGKHPSGLAEILLQMGEKSKTLKTVSANLDYTTVNALVDDRSKQSGQVFFRKGKEPDVFIDFEKPERKLMLLKKNKGQMYLPKMNQVQEADLSQKGDLVQQFLLLGFGSDPNELKKTYDISYLQEVALDDESTVQLELTPRKKDVASQITKVQLWISEDSWLPVQQQFFESNGDYLIAHYTGVKVDKDLPNSTFELNLPSGVQHVKMN